MDFIKDIFSSPDSSFKKLTPGYFLRERMKMKTPEEYSKWLIKQEVKYQVMAQMEKESGRPLPQSWIDGLQLIENERVKIGTQVEVIPPSSAKYDPIQVLAVIVVVLLFAVNFGFRALKLFSNVMSDKDRSYIESVIPINLSSADYLKNIDAAYDYQGNKNYNEMLKSSQKALQSAKTDREKTEAHYWIGLSLFKLKDLRNAETHYNAALAIDPNYVPAHSSLSAVYYEYGKFDEAIKYAKKAISLDPSFAWAHSNLALAYASTDKLAEAAEEVKTAISLSPQVPDFYLNLATIYVQGGHMDEAIDQYNAAIKADEKFERAYYGLALVYARTNNFDKYESEMKLAIEYDKQYADPYLSLFEYYAYSDRTSDLENLITEYLEITGKSKEILKNEINNMEWMAHKNEILKSIDRLK